MSDLVNVRYKGDTYKIKKMYLENLKGAERREQIKSIVENKKRPVVKGFKSRPSNWTTAFKKEYGNITKLEDIAKATGVPLKALKEVERKGRGAYYSGGSRPNQTASSWGRARVYSFLMRGRERKIDDSIVKKYKIKFKN